MVNVNACNQSVVDPFVWDGHSLITFSEAICPGQHVARFSGWFDVLGVDLFQIIHVTKSIRTHKLWNNMNLDSFQVKDCQCPSNLDVLMSAWSRGRPFFFHGAVILAEAVAWRHRRGAVPMGDPPNDGSQGQNMRKCSNELDDLGNPHFRKAPNRYSKREIMRNSGIQDDLGGAIIFLFETKPYRHFLLLLGLQFGWQNVGSSEACHHWDQVMGLYENWRNPNSNGLKPYFISSEQFLISSCWGISKSICLSYIFGTVSHRCQVSSMDSRPRSPRSMPCWTGAWNMQRWSSSAVAALVDEAESAPGIRWNFGSVA